MNKVILLIFFSIINTVSAQEGGRENNYMKLPIPENPNISKFDKVNFTSTNLSKGSLLIEIPLFDIEIEGFKLPINLTYNSKGNKVEDESSFIGLGWNLNLPSIIQTINDENDFTARAREILEPGGNNWSPGIKTLNYRKFTNMDLVSYNDFPSDGFKNKELSYYYLSRHDFPYKGKMNSLFNAQSLSSYSFPYLNIITAQNGIDSEPDFFSVNLIGNNAVFFNNYEYSFGNFSKNMPLTYFGNTDGVSPRDSPKTIGVDKSIIITGDKNRIIADDSKGNTYVFDKKTETISYMNTLNPVTHQISTNIEGTVDRVNVIYYPSKIINISGETIDIEYIIDSGYGRNSFSNFSFFTETASTMMPIRNVIGADAYCGDYSCIIRKGSVVNTKNHQLSVGEIYLPKKIKYNGNEVIFTYSSRSDTQSNSDSIPSNKLDKIEVFDFNGNLVKKIDFINSYFDSEITDLSNNHSLSKENDLKRLRLDHININNELFRKFVYNSKKLPSKNSYSIDYWGYYNGANFNKSYIPNPDDFRYLGHNIMPGNGNNRSSRLEFAKAAVLEEIHYPTKGYEKFDFELNEYINNGYNKLSNWDGISDITKGAGLRIKSNILYNNSNEIEKIINYDYKDGNLPMIISFFRTNSYRTINTHPLAEDPTQYTLYKNEFGIQEMNKYNFYSNQLFTDNDHVFYKKVITNVTAKYNDSESYKKESYFENSNFKKGIIDPSLQEKNSYYPLLNDSNKVENGTLLKEVFFNNRNDTILTNTYNYKIKESPLSYGLKVNSVGSLYYCSECWKSSYSIISSNRSILTFYPLYLNKTILESKKTIEHLNEKVINFEKYNYSDDILLSIEEISNNESKKTQFNYLRKLLVGETIYKNNQLIFHQKSDVMLRSNFIYGDTSFIRNIVRLESQSSCKSLSNDCNELIITKFSEKNKPIEYSYNGRITSIIWGYNEQYIIAKIEGVTYSEISNYAIDLKNVSNNKSLNKESFNTLRNNLPLAMITGYIYKPLIGVTEIIQPNGQSEFYEYDSTNRLKSIKNNDNEIIKIFKYNYSNNTGDGTSNEIDVYHNEEINHTVYKQCSDEQISDPIIYKISANKYASTISISDANTLAKNTEQQAAQNYANNIGVCKPIPYYYNEEIKYTVYKQCGSNQISEPIIYIIPAGKYKSKVSVSDANILAKNSEQQAAQNYANNTGVCKVLYYNEEIKYTVYKQCTSNQFSEPIIYTIPAGKYSSTISVFDANTIARNSEQQAAQDYVNNIGVCITFNCNFSKVSNFNFHFTSFGKNSANSASLHFAMTITAADLKNPIYRWSNGVYIGSVSGYCIPSTRREYSTNIGNTGQLINIYIEPTGDVYIRLYGITSTSGVTPQLNFIYDIK